MTEGEAMDWNQRLEDGMRLLSDDYGTRDDDGLTIWSPKELLTEEEWLWPTI